MAHVFPAALCFFLLWEGATGGGTSHARQTSDADAFTIRHKETGECLTAEGPEGLAVSPCDAGGHFQLWKWGSNHRLFHVATALCLGFKVRSKTLALLDCGSQEPDCMLWWRCMYGTVYTHNQMGLGVSVGKVVAKGDLADVWTRDGSQDGICQRPYRVVHTSDGISAGASCEFPFLYGGTWHHGCLPDPDSPGRSWCSTTADHDRDAQRGHCLTPEEGCQKLFAASETGSCYEFVSDTAVNWQEALDSCRSQGADLLSVSGLEDLASPTVVLGLGRMPEKMWIGLHQLDTTQGWQWSDGSPLSYLRWEPEMPPSSILTASDCGVLNSKQNYMAESCDKKLPYVCKKSMNASNAAPTESSVYVDTVCSEGWVPWSGWCYKLVKNEPRGFLDAQSHCRVGGGAMASLHSLDAKEMISTSFHADGSPLNVWIGLIGTGVNGTVLKWADQAPVTFTYWGANQPTQPTQNPSCVFYSGESHGWTIGSCVEKLPFLCQKKGEVNESATQELCPPEGGWKRHGNSCYQLNPQQVSFKDRCNITIRNRFEQAFINRLLGEQIGRETRYFWVGLQDMNNTGEYQWLSQDGTQGAVTYANWGELEPDRQGGCAVMSTAKPLGKWEVKNCTDFKAGTVCKREITPPPPPEPEPDPNTPCPDGWISNPTIKYCYKVFHGERLSRMRSWEEAQRFCQALGANLPSFTNEDEMSTLHYILRDVISDNRYFWVGLNRRNPGDRSWVWSDSRPVSMAILHQDFHEDDAYNRDCAAFKTMKSSLRHLFVSLFHDDNPRFFYATPFHCDARLEWVCQIPKGKTPKTPEWYNPIGHHETSVFVDGTEFWFVTEPQLAFEEAKLFCSVNGSKLAEPLSFTAARQIHQSLSKMPGSPKQSWWADMRQPGRFFPMTFNQMHFYHSVFLGRCTSLSPENLFPEHDYSCERKLPFVCERHNITLVERFPLQPHADGLPCTNGSLAFRDKCFTFLRTSQASVTFKSANEECMSHRGTLVTISDQVEQDFITTELPKMLVTERIWIGLKLKAHLPEWVDKSPVSFLNFNPLLHGMLRPVPVNALDPEVCVFMINSPSSDVMGTWDYSTCNERQYTGICQHYADKPEEPRVPLEPVHVNNHTIQLLRQNLTWFEAMEQCSKYDMDLASVSDISLQSLLTVYVSRARTPMWIGLFSEDKGIHYRWTDHSHTVFSRWSQEATSGSCVYQDTDGFWKATECEEVLGGAVCHKPHKQTIMKPEDVAVKCPHKVNGPNWIPFKGNCYSFQLVASRWDHYHEGQIQGTCKKLDKSSNILTIRNVEENEFVRQQLSPFQNLVQFVWLGLFKDIIDDQMKWYDGTNVQYSNWRNGRPDVEAEFMAGLNAEGVWELITNKHYFTPFRQRSIVACKLDNEPNADYNQSAKNYQDYGNLTYQVITRRLSWFQALEECGRRGGHLASVHDIQHDAHLKLIAKTDGFPLWIGLSSQEAGGSTYEWSDGTRYDYRADISDAQRGSGSGSDCVYVSPKGGWVKTDCRAPAEGAICYNTTFTTASQRAKLSTVQPPNNCPLTDSASKWVEHQGHCYAFDMGFYNYSVYTMQEAHDVCQSLDAHVLTINTQEENNFVAEHVLDDPLITSRVWLGLDVDKRGLPVAWQDGSALGFSNWNPKSHMVAAADPAAGGELPCVVMVMADRGLWSRVGCRDVRGRVVCKAATRRGGSPVALGLFLVIVLGLLGAIGFLVYKKKKADFSSTVRYKRSFDEADTTSIITEAE